MGRQLIFTVIAVIALQLGTMEGRADILRGRSLPFGPQTKNGVDALLGVTILIAWIVSSCWLLRTWPWYGWIAITIAVMASSYFVVTRQTLTSWLSLRPHVAVATAGSAGILWLYATWP